MNVTKPAAGTLPPLDSLLDTLDLLLDQARTYVRVLPADNTIVPQPYNPLYLD